MGYLSEKEKELEAKLLNSDQNMFGIYQLKPGDDLHYHRWMPYKRLLSENKDVKRENYTLIYIGELDERVTLDSIFYRFNMEQPSDFYGHSLSISDIIVFQQKGKISVNYVDDDENGFTPIQGFLEQVQ